MRMRGLGPRQVVLRDMELLRKREFNRRYLMELKTEHLLRNHYLEAGLWQYPGKLEDGHWGWEAPTSQLRGHFLGHWLSAAARMTAATGDRELAARADFIVSELARCQEANGGRWVGAIPPVYLDRMARGQAVWVPHYNVHKTFMGLLDMYLYAGNRQALDIAVRWAAWFRDWVRPFSRERLDDILDVETGGMLEVWADLYAITGDKDHLDLLEAYARPRLFEPLVAGEDVLSNKHANTTIPEALGAARAHEVTGDGKWRKVVEAYWRQAVTERGMFCTGGQTSGEIWTPPMQLSARLGRRTQEHCSVYNMIRLADVLLRWTGEADYADYIERNLKNGIMAQGYVTDAAVGESEPFLPEFAPEPELIAYYLPLAPGSLKKWGSKRNHFWCCHGSLVQANSDHVHYLYYENEQGLTVAQYVDSDLAWNFGGRDVRVSLRCDPQSGDTQKIPRAAGERLSEPFNQRVILRISCAEPQAFRLRLRRPWWLAGEASVRINGEPVGDFRLEHGFWVIDREWIDDRIELDMPMALSVCPLPDEPDKVAFMFGPEVLAGLTEEERTLVGDIRRPETMLAPDNEREFWLWTHRFRTVGQPVNIRFMPLNKIARERYTVYFPVRAPGKD